MSVISKWFKAKRDQFLRLSPSVKRNVAIGAGLVAVGVGVITKSSVDGSYLVAAIEGAATLVIAHTAMRRFISNSLNHG